MAKQPTDIEQNRGSRNSPAATYPVEIYTPERKAEFILSSAIDDEDYRAARQVVTELGLDPDRIEHLRPAGI